MGQSFFIWNGVDCRSKGIILRGPVPITKPEERVQHVTIPGRSGDLTLLEGDGIYQSYIQTATIHVRGGYRVNEIMNWLKGSGYVTFSGEPDRKQKARVIGAVTLQKHSRNLDIWSGEVQFFCAPLKERLDAYSTEITASGTDVRNNGDVAERPKMTVTLSGNSTTITNGSETFTFTGASGETIVVDSDAETVTNASGDTNRTVLSSGVFPVLQPGANTITGSGWSKIVILRRERFL